MNKKNFGEFCLELPLYAYTNDITNFIVLLSEKYKCIVLAIKYKPAILKSNNKKYKTLSFFKIQYKDMKGT